MIDKKILIVEDEPALLAVLGNSLVKEGFTVIKAKDGQDGLNQALADHPDLILLDVIMPVMDGMTMLKKLRHDQWGTSVPVILMSNLPDSEKSAVLTPNGSLDYLIKSDWKLEEVVKKVKEKLGTG